MGRIGARGYLPPGEANVDNRFPTEPTCDGLAKGERTAIAVTGSRMGREPAVIEQRRRRNRDGARIAPNIRRGKLLTAYAGLGVRWQVEITAAARYIDQRAVQAYDRGLGVGTVGR